MKKFLYTITAAVLLVSSCVKDEIYIPPTPEVSPILLNEIQSKDPITDEDWIELYNTSDQDIDISGYLTIDAADPIGGFVIPENTIIESNGYYLVKQPELTVSISSGGEDVSLGEPDGSLIDLIAVPASNGDGTTFGRETDGSDTWVNGMLATPGASNGNAEVTVPILTLNYEVAPAAGSTVQVELSYLTTETVAEARIYFAAGDNPAYIKDNKIKGEEDASFTQTGVTITMPDTLSVANELVSFYVRLALENGMEYYYDKDGNAIGDDTAIDTDDTASDYFKADPTQWNTYKAIAGGVSAPVLAVNFSATPSVGYEGISLEYTADIAVVEARVYFAAGDAPAYIKGNKIKGEEDASFTQTGVTISMANIDVEDAAGAVVGNTSDGSKISFYVRMALENGMEYYYDKDGNVIADDTTIDTDDVASDDFKADPTMWNTFTAKSIAAVASITYPATPASSEAIPVAITYSSDEEILEARIYFAAGDTPEYIKGNKIKGEDDASFTQTGVTIDMANVDVEDAEGNVVGTTSDSGTKVSFYLRLATATSEYYYGADGVLLAVDDSPSNGATDTSDAFKADPNQWMVYNVQ